MNVGLYMLHTLMLHVIDGEIDHANIVAKGECGALKRVNISRWVNYAPRGNMRFPTSIDGSIMHLGVLSSLSKVYKFYPLFSSI